MKDEDLITTEKLILKFRDELLYRNLTEKTKQKYTYHVNDFLKQVKKSINKICSQDIQDYMVACLKRGLKSSTIIVKRSALKIFAIKCLKIKTIDFGEVKIKTERRIRKVASVEEIKFLISCAKDLRDQTILLTLFATGMRSMEITNLQTTDIDSKRMIIYIRQGKGQKDRIVPLSQELLHGLRHYYKVYRPGLWIFPNKEQTGPMSVHRIGTIWEYVKKHSGLNIIGGVHLLRHCFATHLLDANVNLNSIKQVLGHSSIRSTARYFSFTNKAALECGETINNLLTADAIKSK